MKPLLRLRNEESDPVTKKAIKSILVSLYGCVGCHQSPFYNHHCARAITAFGRVACKTAERLISEGKLTFGTEVICCNTDSVSFLVDFNKIKDVTTEKKR